LEQHNEVAGFIIAVIGGLYAVLLAFVVISVWEQFDAAQTDASREANHVEMLRTEVVDDDWKEMDASCVCGRTHRPEWSKAPVQGLQGTEQPGRHRVRTRTR
jgi:hypothetical protein